MASIDVIPNRWCQVFYKQKWPDDFLFSNSSNLAVVGLEPEYFGLLV